MKAINLKGLLKDVALAKKTKAPTLKDKNNYLGIEIEFITKVNRDTIDLLVAAAGLGKYVHIGYDSSIDCDEYGYDGDEEDGIEARILVKEKELDRVLKSFGEILKHIKAYTNDSCGLHVHIDMRNRNYLECGTKLLKSEPFLLSMMPGHRKGNTYCKSSNFFRDLKEEDVRHWEKYRAINVGSYRSRKTIEVRCHEGTTNMDDVAKWCKLLLGVIKNNTGIITESNYLKVGSIPKGIKTYATKRHNKYKAAKPRDPDDDYDDDIW